MNKYLLLSVTLLTIAFTTLVSIPGSPFLIDGKTQADISALYPTAITPAGITFSIWSVIYFSWIIAGISLLPIFRSHHFWERFPRIAHFLMKGEGRGVALPFSISIWLTGLWLIPWGYQMIGTSLSVMILILLSLKYVFRHSRKSPRALRWSIDLTLGWIHIATIANVSIWLVSVGFTGGGISDAYWAIGVLWLALLLTAYYQCRYHATLISLVFLWALLGIWIAHEPLEMRVALILFAIVTLVNMTLSHLKSHT